jgi:hypothetical protein
LCRPDPEGQIGGGEKKETAGDLFRGAVSIRRVLARHPHEAAEARQKEETTMQYMILIYDDEKTMGTMSESAQKEFMGEYYAYTEAMKAAGVYVAGDALQPTMTATTVRIRNGETLHTDGPFAETREAFGGYYLVDVPDLDAALDWAAKCPSAKVGSIEVRPVMKFD